jgi:RNA polymerase sigma-70 factor (ECF subfamily)
MNAELLDDLLNRMRDGDATAAEHLVQSYEPYLRLVVRRLLPRRLRSKCDSSDVMQSVWTHLVRGLPEAGWHFDGPQQFSAFLTVVARRRVFDRLRRHRLALSHEQTGDVPLGIAAPLSPQPRPSEVAQADDLWERMLHLCPTTHHEVLRLKRSGLTLGEVAQRTGLHEGSVRRILRQLARQLALPPDTTPTAPEP